MKIIKEEYKCCVCGKNNCKHSKKLYREHYHGTIKRTECQNELTFDFGKYVSTNCSRSGKSIESFTNGFQPGYTKRCISYSGNFTDNQVTEEFFLDNKINFIEYCITEYIRGDSYKEFYYLEIID